MFKFDWTIPLNKGYIAKIYLTRCFLQANRWSLQVWHDLIENTFCSLTFLHTKLLFNLHAHKSLTLQTPTRVWQETKACGKIKCPSQHRSSWKLYCFLPCSLVLRACSLETAEDVHLSTMNVAICALQMRLSYGTVTVLKQSVDEWCLQRQESLLFLLMLLG